MRIAIDALGIDAPGGGRTAILSLFTEVFKLDNENHYTIFLTKYEPTLKQFYSNVKQIVIPIHNRFLVRIVTQMILIIKQKNFDLIHNTKNLGFMGLRIPSIITIHDLTTVLHPELVPKIDFFYWKTMERTTLENAKIIITISNDAAKDIISFYKVPRDKVHIIYHGYSSIFAPVNQERINFSRNKYHLPEDYYLHVGRIDKKKNLTLLVEAFAKFVSIGNFPGSLVLVGQEYKKSPDEKLCETIKRLGMQEKVIFTGFIPDEDLPAVYSGAISCVFPSIHEGFGLFALEAMACGVPLIVNKAGALEEVVGDAGIVLQDCTSENLAIAMIDLFQDSTLRRRLRELGLKRAKSFSWKKAAYQLLEIYNNFGVVK